LGLEPFAVAQPRYSLVNRAVEHGYLNAAAAYDLGVCPWSPQAGGFLSGTCEQGEDQPAGSRAAVEPEVAGAYLTDEHFDVLGAVRAVAEDVGATPAQVSLAWLRDREDMSAPVVGARTVDQLQEDLGAADLSLSDARVERLADA
jgi:aryl-alcohol dehydrogenase-like predicted oxidoreductase